MTMKTRIIAFYTLLCVLLSCGPEYVKPVEASQAGFAVSFFKSVNSVEPKTANVVVSPYSAAVTLSMLAEGAQGQTRAEFDKALSDVLYKAEDLGGNDSVVVRSANSLWLDDNFSPRNRYVSLLEKDFDAFIDVENFASPVDNPLQFCVSVALFLFAFVALRFFKLSPILILVLCGAVGGIVYGIV